MGIISRTCGNCTAGAGVAPRAQPTAHQSPPTRCSPRSTRLVRCGLARDWLRVAVPARARAHRYHGNNPLVSIGMLPREVMPTVGNKRRREDDDHASTVSAGAPLANGTVGGGPQLVEVLVDGSLRQLARHPRFCNYAAGMDGAVFSVKAATQVRRVGSLQAASGRWVIGALDGHSVQRPQLRSRFVWEAWNGPIPEGVDCDHIDNDMQNDAVGNLQLLTRSQHAVKTARQNPNKAKRLAAALAIPVIATDADGVEHSFDSLSHMASVAVGGTLTCGAFANALRYGRTCRGWTVRRATPAQHDLPGEEWRPLALATTSNVEVSTYGRIRRPSGRVTTGSDNHGYLAVMIPVSRTWKQRYVHQLVARTFIGPPPTTAHSVNHKNLNKKDNRVENLEWATSREQGEHALGQRVAVFDAASGLPCGEYVSQTAAAEALGVTQATIHHAITHDGITAKQFKVRRIGSDT
jgi:hypothetical protein